MENLQDKIKEGCVRKTANPVGLFRVFQSTAASGLGDIEAVTITESSVPASLVASSRINDGPVRLGNCARGKPCLIDMALAKNVEYVFSYANKIVGNDPSVAPPPNGFCTHYRSESIMPEIPELGQTLVELPCHCVIRIVSEAQVVPEKVG
jgi:hypothetical protein